MDHQEFPPISDEELADYETGKFLLFILGLRTTYRQLLRDYNGRNALWASAVARRLAPGSPDLPGRIRGSVLRIGGYQVWGEVRLSDQVLDRAAGFAIVSILLCTGGGALFYADGSFWRRILYAVVTLASAFLICVLGGLLASVPVLSSRPARALLGLLGLGACAVAGWRLLAWQTVWGLGLSSGIFTAVAVVAVLALLSQLGVLLVTAAHRVSWSRWTADEIVETLTAVHWTLHNVPGPDGLRRASYSLEHLAICVERILPPYLTRYCFPMARPSLTQHSQREFSEIATAIRALARECLLPKAKTRTEVADTVAGLLVTAAQEQWGEWDRAEAEEVERSTRWRAWISGALRLGLGLLPLVLVGVGAFTIYQANPASPLLKAEVLAPVLVAALGFFTTVLSSGSSQEREKTSRSRTPFRGRDRS